MSYLLLFVITLIWAGNFPAGKIALEVIGPLPLIALRADFRSTLILTMTGVVSSGLLFYFGLKMTTASNAGIISASTPIWVTLLSWIFISERFGLINVGGVLLSFAGLVVIICQGSLDTLLNRSFNLGDLLILVGQLNWAIFTVYGRIVLARRSAIAATASAYLTGSVILLPLMLLESPLALLPRLSPTVLLAAAYLCILSPLSNFWYSKALAKVSPHQAAVFMNLMPIIVLLFSALVLGERITSVQIVGTVMVISGVIVTTRF